MTQITTTEALAASVYTAAANYGKTAQDTKSAKESQSLENAEVKKTKVTNGRTIGEPKLSEKAQKYYDQLRKKFSNMDFILVSKDMKQQAQANASRFANPNRMVVLIDEEKIERMAEDENYRKQYEGIISGSSSQMSQLAKSIGKSANAGSVKGFGMQVNSNGTASFFAVIDKSLAAQKKRIEKKAEQKAEAKKQEKKAAEKKKTEDKLAQKAEDEKKAAMKEDEDTITITASSVDELLKKIDDMIYTQMSDNIQTKEELQHGQNFDFAI